MKKSLTLAASIFNMRSSMQQYKDSKCPEVKYYQVKSKDLLDWLSATMIMWNCLEDIEKYMDCLTNALTECRKG